MKVRNRSQWIGAGAVLFAVLSVLSIITFAASARPQEHITGSVLVVDSPTTAIVHHEPFGGMPAMSMQFRFPSETTLQPGDRITAVIDRSTEPWSLSEVVVTPASRPSTTAAINFLEVGDRVPATPLVDANGRATNLDSLRGHPYALTFIYTRCADPRMCPLVSSKLEQLQTRTRGTAIAMVEVSLDPAFDRPAVLQHYARQFGADPHRWQLFTGDPRTVLDFAARFRILERSAGPQTIVHTERLAIVDSHGTIVHFFDDANWRVEEVRQALESALGH